MNPSDLRYSEEHEWVRSRPGGVAEIGITDFAAESLGDVVFVELPAVGSKLCQGDEASVVESVKAASEVYMPVSGEVVEINGVIEDEPTTVNSDPAGEGWFFKIKLSDPSELDDMMDDDAYKSYIAELD